ncbi:MAG: hypothetical protein H2058_07990 [Muricauda sp.]|uniref:Uncharacterized protein n=1 Tax=Flagellimonas abyssi TaxID=2864871 RepID=A0ABS7EMK1_9FLAO|nr:hypothetical protein [Allomuricauda sp.]MBW8198803.1 hypothetical protein [Allomuricauda abyssi]
MTALALAEWGTQFTVLSVFAIEIHYRNDLCAFINTAGIATRHEIECQKVDG